MAVEPELADLLVSTVPSCRLLVAQDEGPYYRDLDLDRRDITEGRGRGALCRAASRLARRLAARRGALSTSGTRSAKAGTRASPVETSGPGETFLRGSQHIDARGLCAFDTVYPGWYPGRTVHIHLIAHVGESRAVTTHLFFPDAVTDAVLGRPGYAGRGEPDTTNATDDIFANHGDETTLTLTPQGAGHLGLLARYGRRPVSPVRPTVQVVGERSTRRIGCATSSPGSRSRTSGSRPTRPRPRSCSRSLGLGDAALPVVIDGDDVHPAATVEQLAAAWGHATPPTRVALRPRRSSAPARPGSRRRSTPPRTGSRRSCSSATCRAARRRTRR